jgi:argininosuccinate lyase
MPPSIFIAGGTVVSVLVVKLGSSLFRTRLAKEFDDRTARFHTSVVEDLRIFDEDIYGTMAHDIMLHDQGIIPQEALKLILSALKEIQGEWHRGELEIGAEYEDIHEYIETRVIEKIGIEAGGMIHTGRSRNDQVMVDVRMRLRLDILDATERILGLVDVLLEKAGQHAETLMMMYTHGQHAQIGTFAHYLTAYADGLLRDYHRLMECYSRVNRNPLGAGPVGGTGIEIDRLRTTELLGFDGLVENSIDATSGRDWAIEAAADCAILMSSLSRAAADLVEWSTVEFGYVELADEYSSSSSIMPQKKNPSTLELIRGKTGEVYGALTELLTMVKGVPTGYYQDLQGTKPPLWRCFDAVETCLEVMTGIISTLTVRKARMFERAEGGLTMAVDLAESLVEEGGLSFRESYRLVASLVRETLEKGRKLSDLESSDVAEAAQNVLGKRVEVDREVIKEATDARSSLMRRKSHGSPHPREMEMMLKERKEMLGSCRSQMQKHRSKLAAASGRLEKAVESILIS